MRPKGYYEIVAKILKGRSKGMSSYLIEAGADAYEEGLKKGAGFRCSVVGVQSIKGGSTVDPLRFNILTQSVVENEDGKTFVSLPNFKFSYEYPPKKGWLVFIPEEGE